MRVAWKDLNFTEQSGPHPIGDVWIDLKPRDIRIWREHPTAIFEATRHAALRGRDRYLLGSYDVPEA